MDRRTFTVTASAALTVAACTRQEEEEAMTRRPSETAAGTNKMFSFTVTTTNPDGVWNLWTDPNTWSQWDRGLSSASMDGSMSLGSVGQIVPLSGPVTAFKVVKFNPKSAYAFETSLPGAVLRVDRGFNDDRTEFTHIVSFSGFAAFAFARILGPGFRRALPPTMKQLKEMAERN